MLKDEVCLLGSFSQVHILVNSSLNAQEPEAGVLHGCSLSSGSLPVPDFS